MRLRKRSRNRSIGTRLLALVVIVSGAPLGAAIVAGSLLEEPMTFGHLATALTLTAFIFGVAIVSTRRIASRLRRLAEAAEQIGVGGADSLPVEGDDEIGRLGTVLNRMVDRLQRANEDVVQAVADHMETLELRRSILDNAAEYAILSDDPQGLIVLANEGAARTFGFERPEDIEGKRFIDFLVPEEGGTKRVEQILRTVESGRTWSGRVTCRHSDGRTFPASVRISPRRDRTGCLLGRVLVLHDISREVEAERRYGDLFHSLQEAVYVTTLDGRFLEANEAMARLVGCESVEEVRELHCADLYADPADREAWLAALDRDGMIRDHEVQIRTRDGRVLTCIESSRALALSSGGTTASYLGTLVDVTERRRLQNQLARTQRMEAVGTLAGGLAHDFNNILAAIEPNAEMIQMDPAAGPSVKDRANTIREAVRRPGGNTSQLQSFARTASGPRSAVEINMVVQEAVRLLEPTLPEGVQLTTELAPDAPPVLADATSLHQLLINLVLNARDAVGQRGSISITTDAAVLDEAFCSGREGLTPGAYGVLSVVDDGMGMDEEQLERLFDPFYTTKGVGQGSGLGLSVAYGIVSACSGHIAVASKPGMGTRFDAYIPEAMRVMGDDQDALSWGRVPLDQIDCVLVVDDEEVVRKEVVSMLRGLGYRGVPVANGKNAVRAFRARQRHIDVVLLDAVLEDQAGFDVRPVIRQLQEVDPDVRIVLMGSENQLRDAQDAGGARSLQKPFDAAALAAAVGAGKKTGT